MKKSSSLPTFQESKNINPTFYDVWTSKKPYNVLKGGRNSFKSSVISLLLVFKMIEAIRAGKRVEIVVIRKVANTIADSVYNKIIWAINKFGLGKKFDYRKSPYKIIHQKTKSAFHFYGQDDFQKLKSNDVGSIIAVWYEEASEFKNAEEFDQTNITFMRQKHPEYEQVQFYWTYNPPRNPYNWINAWTDEVRKDENYFVHSSSYLDDSLGFVTKQILDEIERIKQNDYDYYRYLYLGEPVGLGTNVYNIELMKKVKKIPDDERVLYMYFATDTGHQQSATASLCLTLTHKLGEDLPRVYLIDTYYYSPKGKVRKKAPSQLSKDMYDFETVMQNGYKRTDVRNRTIDSAEGAIRNQYFEDYGINLHPVAKKKKVVMTEYVQTLLAQGRFYYLDTENNNKYFIEEHKTYAWEEKSIMNDDPQVVKENDHTCDAFQYFVMDNLRDLRLAY
jgi:phage terminase large subunit|nr:MAG TPA: large terminase [Caudoviricetes sp.]